MSIECISFTVSARFAHFRRIETSTPSKQTYRIPPRTTIIGFLAAILGENRDSYYNKLNPQNIQISVIPQSDPHTQPIAQLQLPTGEDAKTNKKEFGMGVVDDSKLEHRQRYIIEYISNPEYKILLQINDKDLQTELKNRLQDNKFTYSPYLGLTECQAYIKDVCMESAVPVETPKETDSVVKMENVDINNSDSVVYERLPYDMEKDGNHRKTTEFISLALPTQDTTLEVNSGQTFKLNNEIFQFI